MAVERVGTTGWGVSDLIEGGLACEPESDDMNREGCLCLEGVSELIKCGLAFIRMRM